MVIISKITTSHRSLSMRKIIKKTHIQNCFVVENNKLIMVVYRFSLNCFVLNAIWWLFLINIRVKKCNLTHKIIIFVFYLN